MSAPAREIKIKLEPFKKKNYRERGIKMTKIAILKEIKEIQNDAYFYYNKNNKNLFTNYLPTHNGDNNSLPFKSGVYFLFIEGKIVYIGVSICIYDRIKTHLRDTKKYFNEINFIPTKDKKTAFRIEQHILRNIFMPFFNKDGNFRLKDHGERYEIKKIDRKNYKLYNEDKNRVTVIVCLSLNELRDYVLNELHFREKIPALKINESFRFSFLSYCGITFLP